MEQAEQDSKKNELVRQLPAAWSEVQFFGSWRWRWNDTPLALATNTDGTKAYAIVESEGELFLEVIALRSGELLSSVELESRERNFTLCIAPDERILVCDNGGVSVHTRTGEFERRLCSELPKGKPAEAVVSRDGKRVFCVHTRSLNTYAMETGERLHRGSGMEPLFSVCRGKYLVSCVRRGRAPQLLDAATQSVLHSVDGVGGQTLVHALYHEERQELISLYARGFLSCWHVKGEKPQWETQLAIATERGEQAPDEGPRLLFWSEDRERFYAVFEEGSVYELHSRDGTVLQRHRVPACWKMVLSADESTIVCTRGVSVWSWSTKDLRVSEGDEGFTSCVTSVRFSDDGSLLAAASAVGELRVFQSANLAVVSSEEHPEIGEPELQFVQGSKLLSGAAFGGAIWEWDFRSSGITMHALPARDPMRWYPSCSGDYFWIHYSSGFRTLKTLELRSRMQGDVLLRMEDPVPVAFGFLARSEIALLATRQGVWLFDCTTRQQEQREILDARALALEFSRDCALVRVFTAPQRNDFVVVEDGTAWTPKDSWEQALRFPSLFALTASRGGMPGIDTLIDLSFAFDTVIAADVSPDFERIALGTARGLLLVLRRSSATV